MRTALRLAWREIRNHPRFAAFFALNLALGLSGFVVLDAFEVSVSRALAERSRSFLGADVEVNATSRPLDEAEIDALDAAAGADAEVAQTARLYSMAGHADRARLVELRAIGSAHPLHGRIELEGVGDDALPELRRQLADAPGAWIDPPLRAQLGVSLGDELRIGHRSFRVLGVLERDGGRATAGFSIAPRVTIALERLDETGLVTTGSRIEYQRLYRLAPGADAAGVARAMRAVLSDPRVSARSHDEATRDLARTYAAVTRYLGLVALVAVFLAALGAAHLFRAHLGRRSAELAILVSVGATRGRAQAILALQLVGLGAFAALLASAFGALALPALASGVADAMPPGFAPRVGARSVAIALGVATLGSAGACLPLLARLRRLRPAQLFSEQDRPALAASPRDVLWWLPAGLGFWALACWRAESVWVGSVFAGGFALAASIFAGLGIALLGALALAPRASGLPLRLALRELVAGRMRSVAVFVSLALCALLVSVVPQMRAVLDRDLEGPPGDELPSLFLFDIQPEQRDALAAHVEASGSALQRISPLVRARLERIGGVPVRSAPADAPPPSRARVARDAEAEAQRLRSRRYNLSYRASLTASERLVVGRPFLGAWDGGSAQPAEMSLEVDFAERLGVGLGDLLRFDVQGVGVEGVVVNLREVRWNSFQPNFFVLFQPGVLEAAPAVFLASVPALPPEQRDALQGSIQTAFPNVSTIDVSRAVRRLRSLVDQLQWALRGSAWLTLAVGWLGVTSLARDAARARRWEINLLKVLGAEPAAIRRALDLEFACLGAVAAAVGSAAGLAAAYGLCTGVLEVPWSPSWIPLAPPLLGIPAICVLSVRAAARGVLRERPLALLQAGAA